MPTLRFSHVALNCRDPLETERFYTKHFGFTRTRLVPLGESQIVFLRSGDVYLELFAADGAGSRADKDGPHSPGVRHLAFQVDDVRAKLEAMGAEAEVTLGPLDFSEFIPGWRTAWVRDPDGTIVEVSEGYTD